MGGENFVVAEGHTTPQQPGYPAVFGKGLVQKESASHGRPPSCHLRLGKKNRSQVMAQTTTHQHLSATFNEASFVVPLKHRASRWASTKKELCVVFTGTLLALRTSCRTRMAGSNGTTTPRRYGWTGWNKLNNLHPKCGSRLQHNLSFTIRFRNS